MNPQPPDFWAVAGDREGLDLAVPRGRVVAFISRLPTRFLSFPNGCRCAAGLL